MYFSSYGQINFQMPVDVPNGTALVQVQTNGQTSNTVSVNVAPRAPRLLLLYGTGGYGAIVDASQGNQYNTLPMPSTINIPNFITKPASRGDVLTIYAIGLMIRFLSEFPGEREDMEPQVEYIDSFLDLRAHVEREDLPRHEQRFKERLNEKVTHEIGLLNAALRTERNEIESKIKLLNNSLRQLEYRPGTFMQLEPKPVRDTEIADFQNALNECLAGTFEGTLEADEARYLRIEKLITQASRGAAVAGKSHRRASLV